MWLSKQTDEFGSVLLTFYEDWQDTEAPAAGETGSATTQADDWQSVSLERGYERPVVIATPVATGAGVRSQLRVDDGFTDAFDVTLTAADGTGYAGTVEYLVVDAGTHQIGDDATMTAGATDAGDHWSAITFEQSFAEPPVVLAAVQDATETQPEATHPVEEPRLEPPWSRAPDSRQIDDDPGFGSLDDVVGNLSGDADSGDAATAVVQVRNVTRDGFELRVDETAETRVGYVATDRGWDGVGDGIMHAGITETDGMADVLTTDGDTPDHAVAMAQTESERAAVVNLSVDKTTADIVDGDGSGSVDDSGGQYAQTVGYLAFENVGTFDARTTPKETLKAHWEQALDTDAELSGDPPDEPPVIAGFEPLFQTQSIANNLLEAYDEFIVFGHTHRPELSTRHANAGSWTTRGNPPKMNTYLEIIDGQVSGWDWSPEGRELLFEQ